LSRHRILQPGEESTDGKQETSHDGSEQI
jgi:hypothetical protein